MWKPFPKPSSFEGNTAVDRLVTDHRQVYVNLAHWYLGQMRYAVRPMHRAISQVGGILSNSGMVELDFT
jgi:hypothetical protein